ncbi:TonB-dependent receptor [Xanthomarina sp. F1114]|uniref:TonB-dependent receptor n=1 Tax=Xanthomarina sp. F1114 TaxID=2996019 RepID=UPI00225E024F|nr:TonB-dependent receptor [Xanthomarina sp. F1114]MCX7548173.1 TonB-dependent receptor [Xanthomarina sp. F1114]
MRKHIHKIILLILVFQVSITSAQERGNDTIKTDVIQVVKPYTPTISDAFKVKEIPTLDDDETTAKKEIEYNIFSFPVASTFKPAKGKAAVIDKEKPAIFYDNYASLGLGSYTTILGEVYLNHELSSTDNIGGYLSHHSSQGGIDDVLLDDYFYDTNLNVKFSRKERDLNWNVEGGFKHQVFNWYGLPQPYYDVTSPESQYGVSHTYYGANIGGDISFQDSYFRKANVMFRHFGDNYDSGENRFSADFLADLPISDLDISAKVMLEFLGGSFDRYYNIDSENKYGNFSIGLAPTYRYTQDDLTLDLGVSLFYLNDTQAKESKFYIYPNIAASYRLAAEVLIAYGGIKGGLIQNTYENFTEENKFVSPTLLITPTNQQYHGYVGLRGKVSNSVSYDIKGAYFSEKNKALYRHNDIVFINPEKTYQYGNSFSVVYDDVSTFNIGGELSIDVNRNFKLGLKADFFAYSTDNESEAWNLPNITSSLFMDYQIDKNWFAGASLFYTGERKDQVYDSMVAPVTFTSKTLDGYFDANAHVGYHINDRLSVFVKGNNLANQNYQRWLNYPVQSIQIIGGATYKFDF